MTYYGAKELAEAFRTVRKNTLQIAEDIPEDKYNFKAADDVRTVEKLLTHIALGPRFPYQVHSEKRMTMEGFNFPALFQELVAEEAKPRTKAEVISLLRNEGEKWAGFVSGLSEDFLAQAVTMPPGGTPPSRTRFDMIMSAKEHEMHHRGQLMLIERILGLVPHLTRQMQERMARAHRDKRDDGGRILGAFVVLGCYRMCNCSPKYSGSFPAFHLMLQPTLGFCSAEGCVALQHGIHCGPQIRSCERNIVSGAAVVELSAVNQLPSAIEEKEVRSAGGAEGFRNIL